MGDRGGFPYGCGACGVQETCGAGDIEQVIGVRVVEQVAQVGIGDTGDEIGDVLAADEGGHSRLVGSQRLLTGFVFAFVAAAGGETGTLVGGHAELSHAWISHRNSVAEMDVIICKLSGII